MHPDLDDTVVSLTHAADHPDLDDTVVGADAHAARAASAEHDTAPVEGNVFVEPLAPSYGFRVGPNGRTVLLDAASYVGRSPVSPRIQNGVLPKLIRVVSPRGEVSGTHLEVRQLGTSVIVTDLRSTNGSVVSVPGSAPRALRQSESMVVTPGTLIDIGDGNVIEILPLQRQLGGHGYEQ